MKTIKELQAEYAAVCQAEKAAVEAKQEIKAEIEALAPTTPEEVKKWNEEVGKTDYGSFKMVSQKRWHYSPSVVKLTEDLKILKVEEEESGVATFDETFGLRFAAKKAE